MADDQAGGQVRSLGESRPVAPALRRLRGDALRLWTDAAARREALEAVITAWERGSPDLRECILRVDTAVVVGLRALGLPRGPVRAVRIESMRVGLSGQKLPDCTLVLVGERLRTLLRTHGEADAAFRTWLHESLHARKPYAPGAAAEYREHRGYEEGLTEGLTQIVLKAADLAVAETPFAFYVAAYRVLAGTLQLDAEQLWRALWAFPVGGVRGAFANTVARLRVAPGVPPLGPSQRARLLAVGDTLYRTARANERPDPDSLAVAWRAALR